MSVKMRKKNNKVTLEEIKSTQRKFLKKIGREIMRDLFEKGSCRYLVGGNYAGGNRMIAKRDISVVCAVKDYVVKSLDYSLPNITPCS